MFESAEIATFVFVMKKIQVLILLSVLAVASAFAKPKDGGQTVLKWDFYYQAGWPCEGGTAELPISAGDKERQNQIKDAAHSFLAKGAAGGTLRLRFTDTWSYSHPEMGLRMRGIPGDYIELPGISGKKIVSILLEMAGDNQTRPNITGLDGEELEGGNPWEEQTSAGETRTWNLRNTEAGMPARITLRRKGETKFGRIEITYQEEPQADKKKKLLIELPFRSETNLEGDTIFSLPQNAAGTTTAGQTIKTSFETKYGFEIWARYGFARNTTANGQGIDCLCVNRSGRSATGEAIGAEDYAWIKTPAIPGKTLKQVVVVCAKGRGTGYVNLSASVDPSTGKGGCEFTSDTAFSIRDTQYFNACGAAENTSYYICFSKALNLGIASIDLYYE